MREMPLSVRALSGPEAARHVDALAQLRITVFREFPYLYDGTAEYERRYLETYFRCPDSVVVLVEDGGRIVGASTGLPMVYEEEAFRRPFDERGLDTRHVFYCGESVLLSEYRGRGVGKAFFTAREARARKVGARWMSFCAVVRPADHPLRPAAYRPLDAFWTATGFCKTDGLQSTYRWKDIDQAEETEHLMQYWIKELDSSS
jgi:GNAT superfamily N-acetyltransferase